MSIDKSLRQVEIDDLDPQADPPTKQEKI